MPSQLGMRRHIPPAALAIGLVASACTSATTTTPRSIPTSPAETRPVNTETVITGDIGHPTFTSEWPLGGEPSADEITDLTTAVDSIDGAVLLPLGSMRPDMAVTVEVIEFHLTDRDHVHVTVRNGLGDVLLNLSTFELEQFGSDSCPYATRSGDEWEEITVRGEVGCVHRSGGPIHRVEWVDGARLMLFDSREEELLDWVADWVWLPLESVS